MIDPTLAKTYLLDIGRRPPVPISTDLYEVELNPKKPNRDTTQETFRYLFRFMNKTFCQKSPRSNAHALLGMHARSFIILYCAGKSTLTILKFILGFFSARKLFSG